MRQVPQINPEDFAEKAGKYEFDAGLTREDAAARALRELAEAEQGKTVPFPGTEPPEEGDHRVVLAYNKISDLHERSAICTQALKDKGIPVFSKDAIIVLVGGEAGEKRILAADVFRLRHEVSKTVKYLKLKYTDKGVEAVPLKAPPLEDVRDLLASPAEIFPKIRGIVSHPVFTASGGIVSTAGYNAETGLYIDAGEDVLDGACAIPEAPGGADVQAAIEVFRDILADFPFADEAGFANTIGLFLTILLRNVIPDVTPLFLVKAATAGTGKSLLVKILLLAITGRRAALSTLPESEEELAKVLLSVVMEGGEYFVLDNVNRRLNSGTLASVATSGIVRGRVLGKSEMLTVPARTPIILTGNNPDMSRELARRCVIINLSCDLENPAARTGFRHPNLEEYVLEHRIQILRAAFILGRAWFAAGNPAGGKPMGSFEAWSRVIGGLLSVSGISGFLENAGEFLQIADSDNEDFSGFADAWFQNHGEAAVPVSDLLPLARSAGIVDERKPEGGQKKSLGMLLGRRENMVINGLKVVRGHRYLNNRYWRLKKIEEGGALF
jgi:hypothetical protein